MSQNLHRLLVLILARALELKFFLTSRKYHLHASETASVVVCMTSYPARIRSAWISVESIFRQDFRPLRLILVLATHQFPNRQLPASIRRLTKKGLEILWVEQDRKSFDHLWPAYAANPSCSIVSVDDDKVFPTDLISNLVSESRRAPGKIIGARGWEMRLSESQVFFGANWIRADLATPSERLFVPPGNGSLYPPGSLPASTDDYELMMEICPNADDVWYWAMARMHGTETVCLGLPPHPNVQRQLATPALSDNDPGPREFRAVIEHFGLEENLVRHLV